MVLRQLPVDENSQETAGQTKHFDSRFLQRLATEELAQLIQAASLILRNRADSGSGTTHPVDGISIPLAFPTLTGIENGVFVSLPASPAQSSHLYRPLRVILLHNDPTRDAIRIELRGQVVVGRGTPESFPDLDLGPFNALDLGVSRQHAMITPAESAMLVFDLSSSNGTFVNGRRVLPGLPSSVCTGDVLTFSDLHFKVKIINRY